MSERFFSQQPITGSQVRLDDSEAQHLIKVMRAQPGDCVVLFDGSGAEFPARIDTVLKREVELTVLERREVDRELPQPLVLAVALPKGDRQQWLVEKATELGVTRLIPLLTQRGIAQPTESAIARMQRWVVEASKQCGRNRLMEIAAPQAWTAFAAGGLPGHSRYVAHPRQEQAAGLPPLALPAVFAIGPEGGWTSEEIALALEHAWQAMDLGPRILRVETAAMAVAALGIGAKEKIWGGDPFLPQAPDERRV